MKAFIFAAGLGTRLKPMTDYLPKALVKVGNQPLLQLVMQKLRRSGISGFVVNVHHHSDMMKKYICANCPDTAISDESDFLLDTGGGILHARGFLEGCEMFLAHNADILTNADLAWFQNQWRPDATAILLVSERKTSRYLLFDSKMRLVGWENASSGEVKSPYPGLKPEECSKLAFAGIHIISGHIFDLMTDKSGNFPIMDFYLDICREHPIYGVKADDLRILDAGKPETLQQACRCFEEGDRFWE